MGRLRGDVTCLSIFFGKYGVEIRTNEHNHKGQKAHVHIYIHGEEVASMFLNGDVKDGKMKARDMKVLRQYVIEHASEFQELWDEYQNSAY